MWHSARMKAISCLLCRLVKPPQLAARRLTSWLCRITVAAHGTGNNQSLCIKSQTVCGNLREVSEIISPQKHTVTDSEDSEDKPQSDILYILGIHIQVCNQKVAQVEV